jgi:hypothetical protein
MATITLERERLLKALGGKRGFIGVRIKLGHPAKLCVDVSPDADLRGIQSAMREQEISSLTEIVPVDKRPVARALSLRA